MLKGQVNKMNETGFRRFGTMIDCSRNSVMSVASLKRWIDILAELGYNSLLLYTEDTYEVKDQPFFGYLRGRYSQAELKEIDDYAFSKGIEVIPCIQGLAHMNAIVRWGDYAPHVDIDDIMLVGDEAVYKLIDDMFASLTSSLRTRVVNIGLDEAHNIGRGRYLDQHGLRDRTDILLEHIRRISEIAKKYGCEVCMWSDMFFRLATKGGYYEPHAEIDPAVSDMIPDNVNLIYWDYYHLKEADYDNMIRSHEKIKKGTWFAGGIWTWVGAVPNNRYSINITKSAIKSCKKNGVQDVFLTLWGDDGGECSKFSIIPSLFYASEVAKGITSMATIKEDFKKWCGISFDTFMLLDLPKTPGDDGKRVLNPEKYMLYNDCFMGLFDLSVAEGDGDKYAACARRLALMKKHSEYGYLFRTMHALCEVLAIKYEIGVKTRKAYKAGDKDALRSLICEYKKLSKKLGVFYKALREQWYTDNKPFGFEVQDIRIGGLIRRVASCTERLELYVDGKLDKIEELEQEILDFYGCSEDVHVPVCYNSWRLTVTTSVI